MSAPVTTIDALLDRYPVLLLDAFGVLVDQRGPLLGAIALIERLNREGREWFILTNSASRLPETTAADFAAQGLRVPTERIISSGLLLAPWFREHGLEGSHCLVLGPPDSHRYVERAGGIPLAPIDGTEADCIVIADQKGFDCIAGMDAAVSLALSRLDTGHQLKLILCNPDIIYPRAPALYGFTAGGLAAMMEAILTERYGEAAPGFERLGKPYTPIFEEAARRSGTREMVMIGDQIATDILGASRFGIDSALVGTGLARHETAAGVVRPTWVLQSL